MKIGAVPGVCQVPRALKNKGRTCGPFSLEGVGMVACLDMNQNVTASLSWWLAEVDRAFSANGLLRSYQDVSRDHILAYGFKIFYGFSSSHIGLYWSGGLARKASNSECIDRLRKSDPVFERWISEAEDKIQISKLAHGLFGDGARRLF